MSLQDVTAPDDLHLYGGSLRVEEAEVHAYVYWPYEHQVCHGIRDGHLTVWQGTASVTEAEATSLSVTQSYVEVVASQLEYVVVSSGQAWADDDTVVTAPGTVLFLSNQGAWDGGRLVSTTEGPTAMGAGRVSAAVLEAMNGPVLDNGVLVVDSEMVSQDGDLLDAEGHAVLVGMLADEAPMGGALTPNADGTWSAVCAYGTCAPIPAIDGREDWLPRARPHRPATLNPVVLATPSHVVNPSTLDVLHRPGPTSVFQVAPWTGPDPTRFIDLTEAEATFFYDDQKVGVARFDGIGWVHEPDQDCDLDAVDQGRSATRHGDWMLVSTNEQPVGHWTLYRWVAGACEATKTFEDKVRPGAMASNDRWMVVDTSTFGLTRFDVLTFDGTTWDEPFETIVQSGRTRSGLSLVGDELYLGYPGQDVVEIVDLATATRTEAWRDPASGSSAWGYGVFPDQGRVVVATQRRSLSSLPFRAGELEVYDAFAGKPLAVLWSPMQASGAALGVGQTCAWSANDLLCAFEGDPSLVRFLPEPTNPAW